MRKPRRYPLDWPSGWPRAESRQYASFSVDLTEATNHVEDELRRLGGELIAISSNVPKLSDVEEISWDKQPKDPGVAVYFDLDGERQVIAVDKFTQVHHNIRAIGLSINALRGLERWGTKALVAAAVRGLKELPETAGGRAWWDVLGVDANASRAEVERAFRRGSLERHPDRGGSHEAMAELTDAYHQAKQVAK